MFKVFIPKTEIAETPAYIAISIIYKNRIFRIIILNFNSLFKLIQKNIIEIKDFIIFGYLKILSFSSDKIEIK